MKFLVVLALFAAVAAEPEAEADPWYYYTHGAAAYHPYTYGYGYPYYQYAVPAVKAAEEKVEEVVEAKEVKKPVVYTHPYYYGGYAGLHYPYAYNYAPVAHTVVKPYTYYANSGGAVHVVKKAKQKLMLIQMLGMDMDTDIDHTGEDIVLTDLLIIIHTHMAHTDTTDMADTTMESKLTAANKI